MIKVDEKGYSAVNAYSQKMRNYKHASHANTTSFTGGKANVATESVEGIIDGFMPWMVKKLGVAEKLRGEIMNIIINAMGTGLVAPVFIKYNFLSDADEDTRTYSAWRQPLSAVLAVATQVGMTAPFYKMYDNWANKGEFDEAMNKTLFQDDYWIKKQVKNEAAFKNATADTIKAEVARRKEQQMKALTEAFLDDAHGCRPVYQFADGTSKAMSDKTYKDLLSETINKLEKIDKYTLDGLEETIRLRTKRSKYYRDNYSEARSILEDLKANIENAGNRKDLNKYIAEKISELKANPNHAEMVSILKDIKQRAKIASNNQNNSYTFADIQKALGDKVQNMIAHADKYKDVRTDVEVENMVKQTVEKDRKALTELVEFYSKLKNEITETSSIKSIKQQLETKKAQLGLANSSLDKDFVKEVANRLIERTKKHHGWYKQFTGIFVSLAMLPFTCTLLNWIYPRFMDIFFPNLSNKKHNNSSAKLVEMAPKDTVTVSQPPVQPVSTRFASMKLNTQPTEKKADAKKVEVA